MSLILAWAAAHSAGALAVIAALASILGTVRNVLTQLHAISPEWDGRLGRIGDWLSWVAEHGKQGPFGGWLSLPGVLSKPAPAILPLEKGPQ